MSRQLNNSLQQNEDMRRTAPALAVHGSLSLSLTHSWCSCTMYALLSLHFTVALLHSLVVSTVAAAADHLMVCIPYFPYFQPAKIADGTDNNHHAEDNRTQFLMAIMDSYAAFDVHVTLVLVIPKPEDKGEEDLLQSSLARMPQRKGNLVVVPHIHDILALFKVQGIGRAVLPWACRHELRKARETGRFNYFAYTEDDILFRPEAFALWRRDADLLWDEVPVPVPLPVPLPLPAAVPSRTPRPLRCPSLCPCHCLYACPCARLCLCPTCAVLMLLHTRAYAHAHAHSHAHAHAHAHAHVHAACSEPTLDRRYCCARALA